MRVEPAGSPGNAAAGAASIPYATDRTPPPVDADHPTITRGDVAILSLRLLGVSTFVYGLPAVVVLPALFTESADVTNLSYRLALAAPYGIYLGVGVLLVAVAGYVGPKLLPRARPPGDADMAAPGRELQAAAFSVVGLVAIVWSVHPLAQGIWAWAVPPASGGTEDATSVGAVAHFLEFAATLLIGMVLLLGGKGLAGVVHRLRQPNPFVTPPAEPTRNAP